MRRIFNLISRQCQPKSPPKVTVLQPVSIALRIRKDRCSYHFILSLYTPNAGHIDNTGLAITLFNGGIQIVLSNP
jgi:hypothetical protein